MGAIASIALMAGMGSIDHSEFDHSEINYSEFDHSEINHLEID
jgi:hypothetical protein